MGPKPKTVDEYLAAFPADARARLDDLRALCRAAAPDATEGLKWSTPCYWTGTILFGFAGYQDHANLSVTPRTMALFRGELAGHNPGAMSVRLAYDEPVPTEILARLLAHRVREYEVDGVTWMSRAASGA